MVRREEEKARALPWSRWGRRPQTPFVGRRQLLAGAALVATGARGLAPFTVILDWLLNANHAGLFAAEATGAFARAGLDVRLVSPSDPASPPRLLAAGQADLAISYGSQINLLVAGHLPVVRVATVIGNPLVVLLALAGGGIRTLADLRGRTVGISVPGVDPPLLGVMLGTVGLRLADVHLVDVNYALVTSLLTHRVDVVTGALRNAEVLQVQEMGGTPLLFDPTEHGVPPADELVLIARRDRIGDPRVAAFIGALAEGVAAVQHDPAGLRRRFVAAHPDLDGTFDRASWHATVPLLTPDPGRLDAARYERFAAFCVAAKLIPAPQVLGDYAVQIVP